MQSGFVDGGDIEGRSLLVRADSACAKLACRDDSDLAHEPSLGWDSGKLAFIYESGVKLRSREEGERIIRWAFGKPWIWRGGFLCGRSTVYVCEGETDCISLIDAGFEEDGHTLAVAIPSASTFAEDWAQLFQGKDVILALTAIKLENRPRTESRGF